MALIRSEGLRFPKWRLTLAVYPLMLQSAAVYPLMASIGPGDEVDAEKDQTFRIWTLGGIMVPVVRKDGLVTVDMGTPILEGEWRGGLRPSPPLEGASGSPSTVLPEPEPEYVG